MKLKKMSIIAILAIMILATTNVFSKAVSSYPPGIGIPPGWSSGIYCTEHKATLSPTITSGTVTNINYGQSSTEAAHITVAYALYLGLQGADLQNVIWASPHNTGEKVELTNERVKEYQKVHDEIFQKAGESIIKHTEDENNLKVMVDRPNGTYMVGPYKLDLAVEGASEEAKRMLLKEIKTGKEGTKGVYAVFSGITGVNGDIQELVYSDGSVVTSENGLNVGFPDFGKEFYIRFKPKQEGAIIATGRPTFKVKFLRNVSGTITKFDATTVDYQLNLGEYTAVQISKATGKVNFPQPPLTGPKNSVHTQTQTVDVEMKIELRSHSGGLIATETRHEQVTFERQYDYDSEGSLDTVGGEEVVWVSEPSTSGSIPVTNKKSYTVDLQTLSETSEGKPDWQVDDNKKPVIPDYEYEIARGEGYKYETDIGDLGITLPDAKIDIQIGGHVWIEEGDIKTNLYNGRKDKEERPFAGIQVDLYQADGTLVTTTTTDKNGSYRFYGKVTYKGGSNKEGLPQYPGGINFSEEGTYSLINPLKQYYVVFEYDGQRYQATYSYSNIASPGGYSNAREIGRQEYNAKFTPIYSSPNNYDKAKIELTGANVEIKASKRAYGIDHKIVKDNGEYAALDGDVALTYEDVYNKFLELATSVEFGEPKVGDCLKEWNNRQNNYYLAIIELKKWLAEKGINNEFENIQSFIFDSIMKASTQKDAEGKEVLYPKYEKFVVKELYDTKSKDYTSKQTKTIKIGDTYTYLYSINYDMARYVDFGLCNRLKADIRLQKDLYKTTLIVNGKKEEYEYDKRDLSQESEFWDIRVRAADSLYNGTKAYTRDVRASEYLLGKEDIGDAKTLKAYVTYKIAYKNSGECDIKVDEIVDHYDAEGYVFDIEDKIVKENTFIGDYEGNKIKEVKASTSGIRGEGETTISGEKYKYNNLYLTGIDDMLAPGNVAWVYVTFKVQNDERGKIKLDYLTDPYTTVKDELKVSIGKKNIAEINAYETFYVRDNGITEIPDHLKDGKETVNQNVAGKEAGLIDYDSNPGSLSTLDLDEDGNLKITKTDKPIEGKEGLRASDRQEDDTSQAPNIRLIIDNNDDEIRRIRGYVFEDNRTNKSSDATIGNGEYDEGETKINGVKVELVEIISEVDEYGVSTHTYTGEKVWDSYTFDPSTNQLSLTDNSRYSSGDGRTKIVINGPERTIFEVVDTENIQRDNGEYVYKSLPAGDFYIRFVYGDDDGTTLVNTEKQNARIQELRQKLAQYAGQQLSEQDAIESTEIQNELARAQSSIEVNTVVNSEGRNAKSYNGQDYKSTTYQIGLDQSGDYYGIKGYTNYVGQNYTLDNNVLNSGTDKASMYYYSIAEGDKKANVSDAKDVWYYRTNSNNYSKGADQKVLLNQRAEVLASFEKLASYAPSGSQISDSGNIAEGNTYDYTDEGVKVYDKNNSYYKEKQKQMVKALEENTYITAQTGIINTEIERDRSETEYDLDEALKDTRTLKHTLENVNLGLVERPKAQLKLNKEVTNYTLSLITGKVIANADKTVKNIAFSEHVQHSADKDELGLFKAGEPRVGRPGFGKNEQILEYVDNELLKNSMIKIEYGLFVENVGETDYTDQEFYYTGNEQNPSQNISKTAALKVVDYAANTLGFTSEGQGEWKVSSVDQLIPSKDNSDEDKNYVNRLYVPEASSYKTLIETNQFGDMLVPGTKKEGKLVLSTGSPDAKNDERVYCNMAEIIATSNDVGRRCVYSIPGNEEMADQNLGSDAARETRNPLNRIQVLEIDADSSQEIKISPPTGTETKTNKTIGIEYIKNLIVEGVVSSIKNKLSK